MATDSETADMVGLQELKNSLGIEDGSTVDSIDGFKKALKKKLSCWVCREDDDDDINNNSKNSPVSVSSSSDQDVIEARSTATMTAELKQEKETDSDSYHFTHKKRGLAIIINNEDFSKARDRGLEYKDRPGSSYDVTGLNQSFKKLGFEVLHYENLTAPQMREVLKGANTVFDHHNADCFACSILSHGEELRQHEYDRARHDFVVGVDGGSIATKTIVDFFNDENCISLKGKPRLFFLQMCRGEKFDDGVNIPVTKPRNIAGIQLRATGRGGGLDGGPNHPDRVSITCDTPTSSREPQESHEVPDIPLGTPIPDKPIWKKVSNVPTTPAPLYKDCLIMYATPPGYFALREPSGAFFIQSLCAELDSGLVYRKSLLSVLTRVTRLTAQDYQSKNIKEPSMHGKKATPVVESMLVKDMIFTRK